MRALLLPGTPLLLSGIDGTEPREIAELRSSLYSSLAARDHSLLLTEPIAPFVGLGGFGIDRGLFTATGQLVDGEDYQEAVASLTAADRTAALAASTATAVALLAGAEAGVRLSATTTPAALGPTAAVLLPVDFSAAAHPDGPLAQRPGAARLDAEIHAAIASGSEEAITLLPTLLREAEDTAADFTHLERLLGAVRPRCWSATLLAATDIHHVRYRVIDLELS